MATNKIQEGTVLTITAAADIASGQPVKVEDIVVVSLGAIPSGASGSAALTGVWQLPKVSAGAIAQGKKVYLTPAGAITSTASGNTATGFAAAAAADGEDLIQVLLAQ